MRLTAARTGSSFLFRFIIDLRLSCDRSCGNGFVICLYPYTVHASAKKVKKNRPFQRNRRLSVVRPVRFERMGFEVGAALYSVLHQRQNVFSLNLVVIK